MTAKRPVTINDTNDIIQELLSRLERLEKGQKVFNDSTEENYTKKARDYLKAKGKVV